MYARLGKTHPAPSVEKKGLNITLLYRMKGSLQKRLPSAVALQKGGGGCRGCQRQKDLLAGDNGQYRVHHQLLQQKTLFTSHTPFTADIGGLAVCIMVVGLCNKNVYIEISLLIRLKCGLFKGVLW